METLFIGLGGLLFLGLDHVVHAVEAVLSSNCEFFVGLVHVCERTGQLGQLHGLLGNSLHQCLEHDFRLIVRGRDRSKDRALDYRIGKGAMVRVVVWSQAKGTRIMHRGWNMARGASVGYIVWRIAMDGLARAVVWSKSRGAGVVGTNVGVQVGGAKARQMGARDEWRSVG